MRSLEIEHGNIITTTGDEATVRGELQTIESSLGSSTRSLRRVASDVPRAHREVGTDGRPYIGIKAMLTNARYPIIVTDQLADVHP